MRLVLELPQAAPSPYIPDPALEARQYEEALELALEARLGDGDEGLGALARATAVERGDAVTT